MISYKEKLKLGHQVLPGNSSDDLLPSLSDLHDFEPKLEFDDTELIPRIECDQLGDISETEIIAENTIIQDEFSLLTNLGESEFEYQLKSEIEDQIVIQPQCEILGTDKQGRHIFAIYANRFPDKSKIEQFLGDIIKIMDPYVENDYILVYFHQGMKEDSKPSVQLLWNFYKELDKKFRKNLKNLYVVHPTWFIKIVWNFFKPFVSEKFKKKLVYISSLDELRQELGLKNLKFSNDICDIDEQINAGKKSFYNSESNVTLCPTTQFGVDLKYIIENSPCLNYIPPIVRKCVDSLSMTGMIDTEGIFRRSGNHSVINELKNKVNSGEEVDLNEYEVHVIAGLLKSFFRDLKEPLLTYELHEEIVGFLEIAKEERSRCVKQMLREKLPIANYELFKYLIEFLVKVMECEDLNKMTSSNLAIVFGPNLIWSINHQMSLEEIPAINAFVDFVLQNAKDIYFVNINNEPKID